MSWGLGIHGKMVTELGICKVYGGHGGSWSEVRLLGAGYRIRCFRLAWLWHNDVCMSSWWFSLRQKN